MLSQISISESHFNKNDPNKVDELLSDHNINVLKEKDLVRNFENILSFKITPIHIFTTHKSNIEITIWNPELN